MCLLDAAKALHACYACTVMYETFIHFITPSANMVQFTVEQRAFVVQKYHETKSYVTTQNTFRIRFPDREPPTKRTIWKNVKKYGEHGTSLNRNTGRSGRPRTGRSQENIELVREAVEINPRISSRRNGSGIPHSTFNNITRNDLHLHPCHQSHPCSASKEGRSGVLPISQKGAIAKVVITLGSPRRLNSTQCLVITLSTFCKN